MSDCEKCGRDNGHWLGCPAALRDHARNLAEPDFTEALCGKDGCSNPRAVSKGPRPAKYCEDHKTRSK